MSRKKRRFEELEANASKPKENISYRDPFQEKVGTRVEEIGSKLQGQGRNILYGIGALVVIGILIGIFYLWNSRSSAAAAGSIGKGDRDVTGDCFTLAATSWVHANPSKPSVNEPRPQSQSLKASHRNMAALSVKKPGILRQSIALPSTVRPRSRNCVHYPARIAASASCQNSLSHRLYRTTVNMMKRCRCSKILPIRRIRSLPKTP